MGKIVKPLLVPFLFILAALSLSPWKFDFPLNDDWMYFIPVKHLLLDGKIILSDMASPTQITHVLWGALWAKFFGLNFAVLRLSTIALGAGAIFLLYLLLKECGAKDSGAAVACACAAFNPVFFLLSSSFMTDVPYLFWMLLSLYCYMRHERNDSGYWFWAASVFSCLCYLSRQTGIFLPLAYSLFLASERRITAKALFKIWILPVLAVSGHAFWFSFIHGPTWASSNYVIKGTIGHISAPGRLLSDIFTRAMASAMETGFFLLPMTAGIAVYPGQFFRRKSPLRLETSGYILLAAFIVSALGYLISAGPMPYLENTFSRTGLGVVTVGGTKLKLSGIFAKNWFWNTATVLGFLSAAVFIAALPGKKTSTGKMSLVSYACLSQFAFSLLGARFFDRYLLLLLPWQALTLAVALNNRRFSNLLNFGGIFLAAALGWAGTMDYFAWNEAKWKAGMLCRQSGITEPETANGFDWDGYFNHEPNMARLKSAKPLALIGEWEWQAILPRKAATSFQPPSDPSLILGKAEYSTPLAYSKGTVYLIKL